VHFASGQRAYLDVDVASRADLQRLAVVIDIEDADQQTAFNTSSERLTGSSFALRAGERVTCTFELQLHLVPGRFQVSAWVYRYDTQTQYDAWQNAETFFVSADVDVRGVANLNPKVSFSDVAADALVERHVARSPS
jgi:hypothetical protein